MLCGESWFLEFCVDGLFVYCGVWDFFSFFEFGDLFVVNDMCVFKVCFEVRCYLSGGCVEVLVIELEFDCL